MDYFDLNIPSNTPQLIVPTGENKGKILNEGLTIKKG